MMSTSQRIYWILPTTKALNPQWLSQFQLLFALFQICTFTIIYYLEEKAISTIKSCNSKIETVNDNNQQRQTFCFLFFFPFFLFFPFRFFGEDFSTLSSSKDSCNICKVIRKYLTKAYSQLSKDQLTGILYPSTSELPKSVTWWIIVPDFEVPPDISKKISHAST